MLVKQINKEVEDFKSRQIQIVQNLYFNQYSILNRIFFFYNSKYANLSSTQGGLDQFDDEGDRAYFENISKNPCKVCSKSIDFDTKNIRLLTTGGGNTLKTWFMERDLKYWMRDKQFGKTLNRLFKELPIFGSVVIKVIDGVPYFVDLRNFVMEQSSDSLDDSTFITEIHHLTPTNFRKIAKKMKWKEADIKDVIAQFYKMKGQSHIRLFERYGDVEQKDGSYKWQRAFMADVEVDEYDQNRQLTIKHPAIVLSEENWDSHPYWEFHMDKMSGRWLGIGVVESLFEPQIAINEESNLQSKSAYWTALRLFFSRDSSLRGELLGNRINGEVLTGESEITQIDMSDRNLAFFSQLHQKWLSNRDELTFSYDVVQGERLPAGTPLGSAQIAISQTLSYFEMIQENVALDVKEMLYEAIIPSFEKDMTKEHILRLVGNDLDQYIAMVKNELVLKEVVRVALQGKVPTNKEKDVIEVAITESIKQKKEQLLTIPKNYYEGIKYDVDIDITGESVDTRVRTATMFALLQAVTTDPTALTDPKKKKMIYRIAEDGGVNPNDLFDVEEKPTEAALPPTAIPQRGGGGVSSPVLNQALQGAQTTTV